MPATNNRLLKVLGATIVFVAVLSGDVEPAIAHPMPDTEITVIRSEKELNLSIRLPMSELMLALPSQRSLDAGELLIDGQSDLRTYFAAHTRLVSSQDVTAPITIRSLQLNRDDDADIGSYAELEVIASVHVGGAVPLTLVYDAVLHRVANHRAIVRDNSGQLLGVIHYSLALKAATPLQLPFSGSIP